MRVLWTTAAVTLAASLPLFVYGIDWGRWIYIHVFSIAMLLMLADARRAGGRTTGSEVPHMSYRHRLAAGFFLGLYATCWALPVSTEAPRMGYLDRALAVVHRAPQSARHTAAD